MFYIQLHGSHAENLSPRSSDVSLIDFLVWSALQQKLYQQEI